LSAASAEGLLLLGSAACDVRPVLCGGAAAARPASGRSEAVEVGCEPLRGSAAGLSKWLPELRSAAPSFNGIMSARGEKRRSWSDCPDPCSSSTADRIDGLSESLGFPLLSVLFSDGTERSPVPAALDCGWSPALLPPVSLTTFGFALRWLLNKSRGLFFILNLLSSRIWTALPRRFRYYFKLFKTSVSLTLRLAFPDPPPGNPRSAARRLTVGPMHTTSPTVT
jgi:hypothetical protein